jgi:Ca2+-binding RTX toxin-like protein
MGDGPTIVAFGTISSGYYSNHEISDAYFGTVLRDHGLTLASDGWTVDENTIQALEYLQVGSIRFPGGYDGTTHYNDDGSIKSNGFNLGNAEDFSQIAAAIDYCAIEHLKLNYTIDDIFYFSQPFATLEGDILNLLQYADSRGVEIESIKIGNEFKGRDVDYSTILPNSGKGTWAGYATGVSQLAPWLEMIVNSHGGQSPKIVIETPNWWSGHNGAAGFLSLLTASGISSIDSVDVHSATGGGAKTLGLTWSSVLGDDTHTSQLQELLGIADIWNKVSPDISLRVDAWSFDEASGGASLHNAALAMLQFYNYSLVGVDSATAWIGYAGSEQDARSNHLIYNVQGQPFVLDDSVTAGAAIFSLMHDTLIGTHAVTFNDGIAGLDATGSLQGGYGEDQPSLTRIFLGADSLVLYVVNMTDGSLPFDLVASQLVSSLEIFAGGILDCSATVLGVADGSNPTDFQSDVEITHTDLSSASLSVNDDNSYDLILDPFEIAQIVIPANGSFGSDTNDHMTGSSGNDTVHGLSGNDEIFSYEGDDALFGGDGHDTLDGGIGDDTLYGGAGEDRLIGGSGDDWAAYTYATANLIADLANPAVNTGDAYGDSYFDIENLYGSKFNDTLSGDSGENEIHGAAGNDVISGNSGNDLLLGESGDDLINGGEGNDVIVGGVGKDTMLGGDGSDKFVFYSPNDGGDTILDYSRGDRLVFSTSGFLDYYKNTVPNAEGFENRDIADQFFISFHGGSIEVWWDPDQSGPSEAHEIVDLYGLRGGLMPDGNHHLPMLDSFIFI